MTQAEKSKYCPKPAGYLMTPNGKVPVACNKWGCPHCGEIKLTRLANRVNFGFGNLDRLFRITITQRLGSERNIMKDWTLVKQRLERLLGTKIRYFWVKEKQKNGQRHLHLLVDQPIDWRKLKDIYADVTRGESFHIYVSEEPCKHPFGYMLKYMGKDLDSYFMWKAKERKFGFSRDKCFKNSGDHPSFQRYNYYLGDFWEIIINPEKKFVRMCKEEAINFMEDYVDSTGIFAT